MIDNGLTSFILRHFKLTRSTGFLNQLFLKREKEANYLNRNTNKDS